MSDRFAKVYQPLDKFDFRTLVHDWSSSECIRLRNSATHRVTSISEVGDQVDTSLELLEAAVLDRLPVTFQLWLKDDTDITCGIRFLSDYRLVEEYALDGLSQKEIDRVLQVIVARFKMKAVEDTSLFLVADREGYTLGLNWDQLSVTGRYEDTTCPDVLGIPLERSIDFKQCGDISNPSVRFCEYLILTKNVEGQ
jgi:hypothetical protein